jgi:hypothetical protein
MTLGHGCLAGRSEPARAGWVLSAPSYVRRRILGEPGCRGSDHYGGSARHSAGLHSMGDSDLEKSGGRSVNLTVGTLGAVFASVSATTGARLDFSRYGDGICDMLALCPRETIGSRGDMRQWESSLPALFL